MATRPLVFRYTPNSLNLFYTFDGNKNVSDVFYRLTSNGIGAHYDYAPFGATVRTDSASSASFDIVSLNPFRFSSEYYDSELDLVYYNFRHYSPSLGRFLSRDPIQEQGGLNLYAFAENRAFQLVDVLGRSYWEAYLNNNEYTTGAVWKLVGGHIYGYHLDAPNIYYNSCALRVSISLLKCGKRISRSDGGILNDDFRTYKKTTDPVTGLPIKSGTLLKGDGKFYIIRASQMMKFLERAFGSSTYTWKTKNDAFKYRKCIEKQEKTAFFADVGHTGMIRKATTIAISLKNPRGRFGCCENTSFAPIDLSLRLFVVPRKGKDPVSQSFNPSCEIRLRLMESEVCVWQPRASEETRHYCSVLYKYTVLKSTDCRLAPGDILYSLIPMEEDAFLGKRAWRLSETGVEKWARIFPGTEVVYISSEYLNSLISSSSEHMDYFRRDIWFVYRGIFPEISEETGE